MQQFLLVGSSAALALALMSLSIAASIILKYEKPKKSYSYIFFFVTAVMFTLYVFLWQLALGHTTVSGTPSNSPEPINISPLWLSAIGTTLLAAMTFVVSILLPWWKRPKFKVEFDNKEPFCRKPGPRLWPGGGESYWMRLKVTNSGRSVAKTCTGRLVKFIGVTKGEEIEGHDLVQLHWINTLWGNQELFKSIDLNQGEHNFLDVLVTRPEHPGKALLFMSPVNLFSSNPDTVPDGTGRIQVTVYGDNIRPCSKEYSISWEGSGYTDIRLNGE